jgi:hypothetical protein
MKAEKERRREQRLRLLDGTIGRALAAKRRPPQLRAAACPDAPLPPPTSACQERTVVARYWPTAKRQAPVSALIGC